MARRGLALAVGLLIGACGTDTDVAVPPTIEVSRLAVALAAPTGGAPAPATIHIINATDGTLEGLSATVVDPAGGTWLTAALDRTTATRTQPATLTLTATAATLAPGVYDAAVQVAAVGAANGPITIHVELTVATVP